MGVNLTASVDCFIEIDIVIFPPFYLIHPVILITS